MLYNDKKFLIICDHVKNDFLHDEILKRQLFISYNSMSKLYKIYTQQPFKYSTTIQTLNNHSNTQQPSTSEGHAVRSNNRINWNA